MRYRVRSGMAAWLLHRAAGIGILLFLFLHIVDITLVGWGPEVFDRLLFIYRALPFRILEVVLLGGVLYHALNGLRIILIDFRRATLGFQRALFLGELAVFTVVFIPAAYLMLQ
jgi:succinate dehydrogenase / fumarate reductase cytochrome b subunit